MQMGPFDRVQPVMQVFLEQDVPETVLRQTLVAHSEHAPRAHQAMPSVQRVAQIVDCLSLVVGPDARQDLGREGLALDAGYTQRVPQLSRQTIDTLGDRRLEVRGQRLPVESRPLNPAPIRISYQISPLLHAAQQLDRKEG